MIVSNAMKQNTATRTSIILHGHFYQPPRENPLVDLIPDQPSAKPHANWNERVYSECYRTNAYSRYLDGFGHVIDIVNNYKHISFNFGPTLLTWLDKYHNRTYRRIIEADRKSLETFGHGNAIAQVYNHTILPLASSGDIRTQIAWGKRDFQNRFDRDPEGMWLSETAVNKEVIDALLEENIKFIILSPYQCSRVENERGEMISVKDGALCHHEPFLIEGNSGDAITAFFYHPNLASDISFGHLLRDADNMYETLTGIRDAEDSSLIHTATDGEIYGHHEPFGDMALAALVKKVESRDDFELTNYASYLEKHPAVKKAELMEGEEQRGTSWSCAHGVSRWYKDCGCNTGSQQGWNQKWRTPLREAFDILATSVDAVFNKEVERITEKTISPEKLLFLYVDVISNQISVDIFFERLEEQKVTIHDHATLAQLLEGEKFKHYMYTSCGWFFNDLSGIEPRQNINYAIQCLRLYKNRLDDSVEKNFLNTLAKAKSNKKNEGSGKTIAKSFLSNPPGVFEAGAYFLMNRNFARKEDRTNEYGKYILKDYAKMDKEKNIYELTIYDHHSTCIHSIEARVTIEDTEGFVVDMRLVNKESASGDSLRLDPSMIPLKMLGEVYSWIDHSMNRLSDEEMLNISRHINYYSLIVHNAKNIAKESLFIENMGISLSALRSLFTTPETISWENKRESISNILKFISHAGQDSARKTVREIFTAEIERVATSIDEIGFNYERGSYLLDLLLLAREHGFQPGITLAQESLQTYLRGEKRMEITTVMTSALLRQLQVELNFSSLE